MEKQYGHLIYTRANPGYDVNGKTLTSQGYCIHSFSQGFFQPFAGNESFLDVNIIKMNTRLRGSSYAYCCTPDGKANAFIKVVPRTEADAEAAAVAGVDPRCDHTLELLSCISDRSPHRLLGSTFFQAAHRPIAAYYENRSPIPPQPPIPVSAVPDGTLCGDAALQYLRLSPQHVQDVRYCVAWLMQEYDKPITERHALVVEDSEENVCRLVACILNALPAAAAREISFVTSCNLKKNKVWIRLNKQTLAFEKSTNLENPNQVSVPLFMINGVASKSDLNADPMIVTLEMLRAQSNPAAKVDPGLLSTRFVENIGTADQQLSCFADYAKEMKNIHMGTHLCKLFDACDLATTISHWDYNGLTYALDVLIPHLVPNSILLRRILFEFDKNRVYQKKFARDDFNAGLKLLRQLTMLERAAGRDGSMISNIIEVQIDIVLNEAGRFTDAEAAYVDALVQENGGRDALKRLQDEPMSETLDLRSSLWNLPYADTVLRYFRQQLLMPNNADAMKKLLASSMQNEAVFNCLFMHLGEALLTSPQFVSTAGVKHGCRWWGALLGAGVSVETLKRRVEDAHLANEQEVLVQLFRASTMEIKDVCAQKDKVVGLLRSVSGRERAKLLARFDEMLPMTIEGLRTAKVLCREADPITVKTMQRTRALLALHKLADPQMPLKNAWPEAERELEEINLLGLGLNHRDGIGKEVMDRLQKGNAAPLAPAVAIKLGVMIDNKDWHDAFAEYVCQDAGEKSGRGALLIELCQYAAFIEGKQEHLNSILAEGILQDCNCQFALMGMLDHLKGVLGRYNMGRRREALLDKLRSREATRGRCNTKAAAEFLEELLNDAEEAYEQDHPSKLRDIAQGFTGLFRRKK